jgi:hypothetical protein
LLGVTRRRALDLLLLAWGIALLVLGLLSHNGSGDIWIGAGLILGSVVRLAVPGYKFDPQRSAIQQWRERRRS